MRMKFWGIILVIITFVTICAATWAESNELDLLLKDLKIEWQKPGGDHGKDKCPPRHNITFKREIGQFADSPLLDNSVELGIAINPKFDLVLGTTFVHKNIYYFEDFGIFASLGARYKFYQRRDFDSYLYTSCGIGYERNEWFAERYKRSKFGLGLEYDLSDHFGLVGEAGIRYTCYEGPISVSVFGSDASVGLRYYF
jgi:hypothetical protein